MIKRVLVYGKVTGVFFRFFIRQNAKRIGLKGFVKNVEDHIELVLEGGREDIEEMIKICWQGPPGSKVEDVKVEEISNYLGTFDDFEILK